jgi:hypothetical protein
MQKIEYHVIRVFLFVKESCHMLTLERFKAARGVLQGVIRNTNLI